MNCINCGEPLHKNDIFCINCETPVYTDDDLALMGSMDVDGSDISDDPVQDTIMRSSSGRIFDSLSRKRNSAGNKQSDDSNKDYNKKNNSGRNAIIITAAVVFAVVFGFILYLWLSSSSPGQTGPNPLPPVVNGDGNVNGSEDPANPDDIVVTPTPDVIFGVTSIEVLRGGRVQTEFHVSVGETVLLTSRLSPEGTTGNVTWSSSDPEILEVTQSDPSGVEAKVVGLKAGVEDIIVTVDDIEVRYIVFVDTMPITMQLENALSDPETPIWLTISWLDDSLFGQERVFERDSETGTWTLESATERGEVEPTFENDDGIIIISFPDTDLMYYLFDDATGYYKNLDGTEIEDFMWWFKTTLIEPEG